tara:strand:+ start:5925 stop:7238 length:1314 start_codon:yes stop_codon:yes gene_type:complete
MTNLSSLVGFSSGGGGSSSSSSGGSVKPSILYDEDYTGTFEAGWDELASYSRVHQYTPRGQFAIHSHTFNSSANNNSNPLYHNRLRIAPFTVNQSTGAMTWGTKSNAFLNTGGYVHSTQSYGFSGSYGVNWGYSAWGSNNNHYNGGCVWRIVNNALVGGQSTGNTNYAPENTSNGMLGVYEHSGYAYYNIPNGQYTSLGTINSSGTANDWANGNETNHSNGSTYIYRCVGNTVGENHAGLMVNNDGIKAMNAAGGAGTVGTLFSEGGAQAQSGGIGFELESGVQVFFTNKGTYIRGSKTGGITYKATVSQYGTTGSSLPNIGSGGTDLTKVGIMFTNFTYNTGGYPAKEDDTFYYYSGSTTQSMIKFKIRNPSAGNVTLEKLGEIDLSEIAGTSGVGSYSGLIDVTGDDDQFLVCSYRTGSYRPNSTIVVDNPIKDA